MDILRRVALIVHVYRVQLVHKLNNDLKFMLKMALCPKPLPLSIILTLLTLGACVSVMVVALSVCLCVCVCS